MYFSFPTTPSDYIIFYNFYFFYFRFILNRFEYIKNEEIYQDFFSEI